MPNQTLSDDEVRSWVAALCAKLGIRTPQWPTKRNKVRKLRKWVAQQQRQESYAGWFVERFNNILQDKGT